MKMIQVKTSELTGAALDWAVAVATRGQDNMPSVMQWKLWNDYHPTKSWLITAPFIDLFQIFLSPPHIVFATKIVDGKRQSADKLYDCWTAKISTRVAMKPSPIEGLPGLGGNYSGEGPTPLIAICRAVVACRLGDVVEVPAELVEGCAA